MSDVVKKWICMYLNGKECKETTTEAPFSETIEDILESFENIDDYLIILEYIDGKNSIGTQDVKKGDPRQYPGLDLTDRVTHVMIDPLYIKTAEEKDFNYLKSGIVLEKKGKQISIYTSS